MAGLRVVLRGPNTLLFLTMFTRLWLKLNTNTDGKPSALLDPPARSAKQEFARTEHRPTFWS